jgi:hypothetical protein
VKLISIRVLIGILGLMLWVPTASASTITLTNSDTLTLKLSGNPTITRSDTASISGEACYPFPEESYNGGTTNSYTTVTIPGGYTWLTSISATNAAGSSSNNFSGAGPLPSGSTRGYILEAATTSQFYTWTTTNSSAKVGTFSDTYSSIYSLSNATGNPFVDVSWYTKAELFLDNLLVASSTPINVSQSAEPSKFLGDLAGSNTGVLTYARLGNDKFTAGSHTFELRLTSYELGHTMSVIPIPGSVQFLGTWLVGMALLRFRRRKKRF